MRALSATSSASGAAVTYTAPASVPSPATVTVTATSVADGTKKGTATVTVTAASTGVSVTLSLTTANVTVGLTQAFTATVANDSANGGCELGAIRCGLQRRDLRNAFRGQQRLGHADYLYSACGDSNSRSGDANGRIGDRYNEDATAAITVVAVASGVTITPKAGV